MTTTKLTEAQFVALKTVLASGGEFVTTMGRISRRGDITVRRNRRTGDVFPAINRRMESRLLAAGLLETQWMLRDRPLSIDVWPEGSRMRTHYPVTVVHARGCAAVNEYAAARAAGGR